MTTGHSANPTPSAPGTAPAPVRKFSRWRLALAAAAIAYTVGLVAVWIWLRVQGDRAPLATMFLFGPRWICALPLVVLVPLAAVWQRRLLAVLALAGLVILFPIAGLELNVSSSTAPYRLRIITCNVAQRSYHADALARMVAELEPDVVALQEIKRLPPDLVWPRDWYVEIVDEMLVASKYPIEKAGRAYRPTIPNKPAVARFLLKRPDGDVQLFNLHLMTPRPGLEAVLDRRRGLDFAGMAKLADVIRKRDEESAAISRWVAEFEGPKIVVGDFNTPADSVIFHEYWSFLSNAFGSKGLGFGFTKQTGSPGWKYGSRIDHVLYSPPWKCVRAWIGPDIGSDHLPLVVDLY